MSWQKDKKWSDIFIPEIKSVLGKNLIGEPPIEEDQERNTDLMVFKMDAVRVGCRIRKHNYLKTYGGQITVREGRPSGAKTELTKIIEGWGDYFFYGFSDPEYKKLSAWRLCNMNVFRLWFNREILRTKKVPGIGKNNTDGSSTFRAFVVNELPQEFIVDSYGFNAALKHEIITDSMGYTEAENERFDAQINPIVSPINP